MKSLSVTIQMKATEQYFLWYCLLCCTRWFKLLNLWMKSYGVTIQMKATEQYFPVVFSCGIFYFSRTAKKFQDDCSTQVQFSKLI